MSRSLHKPDIAARFSAAARHYADHARLQQGAADRILDILLPEGTVLDLGCGSGREAVLLAARPQVQQVLALDLAEGMLETVPASPRITCLAADAERLPLAEASVDGIFSNFALQWCESQEAVCRELRRVLKPGGRLALAVPGPQSLSHLRLPGLLHINQFAPGETWVQALRNVGFERIAWHSQMVTDYFPDARGLLHALKAIGANTRDQRGGSGLKGRAWLADISARLEQQRGPYGLPLSYEVIYIVVQG